MSARRRHKRSREYPGIVFRLMGVWVRLVEPPYGMQVLK